MIIVKQNFLDEVFIDNFLQKLIIKSQKYKPIWKSNINWGKNIVKGSSLVLAYELNKIDLTYIKSKFVKLDKSFKDKEIIGHFYIWTRGSQIPFHNDTNYTHGCTIYLNKNWDIDWGGLYLWLKDDKLNAEKPEFNKLIINTNNTRHGTSIINYNAPEERLTLQVFFK
jgi:hypothetical protein